ncbi:hypothetical protein NUW58_g6296 [Xylaria curta]|uniref:Uncharacterized protein n=1 Tax=Xylaria curta TaxID=42375 RepID=A0ACC1NWI7_9PEZI|nr:hypothetical protein NUW58_g6296 [Xylaria curta]
MRLLQRQDDGSLTLTTFSDDNIPPYGMLSHTWGEEDEEVTFREITEGVTLQKYDYKQKKGYKKIDFCANAAADDNLQHFWVDSCCIDKSSYPELQEAIMSMFRWYQSAAKCYVYLSNVIIGNEQQQRPSSRPAWEFAFRKSRWFTRGWTQVNITKATPHVPCKPEVWNAAIAAFYAGIRDPKPRNPKVISSDGPIDGTEKLQRVAVLPSIREISDTKTLDGLTDSINPDVRISDVTWEEPRYRAQRVH